MTRRLPLLALLALLLPLGFAARGPVQADDADPAAPAGEDPPPASPDAPPAQPAEDAAKSAAGGDDEGPLVPEAIDLRTKKAVEKGVAWLRARALNGHWGPIAKSSDPNYNKKDETYTYPYSASSLALYTLLKCGVRPDDPVVRSGFVWLKKAPTAGYAYEVSMKLLAVTATADPFKRTKDASSAGDKVKLTGEMRAWAQDLLTTLVRLRAAYGWRYMGPTDETKGGKQDLSSTQLATLALFAADRCGLKIDPAIWTGIIKYSLSQQQNDGPAHPRAVYPRPAKPVGSPGPSAREGTGAAPVGPPASATDAARGFAYVLGGKLPTYESTPSGSMTACGIGCLMMARFALMTRAPKVWATQDAAAVQRGVYDGLAWLDRNWSAVENPPTGWHIPLYYHYCVERAMDLVGGWKLGEHLWYLEMAEQILARQSEKGFWDLKNGWLNGEVLDTCFALLFLQRATKGGIPFPSVTGGSEEPAADSR